MTKDINTGDLLPEQIAHKQIAHERTTVEERNYYV